MINTKCFICESDDNEPFLSAKDTLGITETKCRRCGLIFLNPAPDREEMKVFYPGGYWLKRENALEGIYRDCIMRLELGSFKRFMGKGIRQLEVGSGSGELLYNAEKMGFDCYGVEISGEMVEYARKTFGLERVKNADLLSASFDNEFFDNIIFNHVFEHIDNPVATFMEVKRILKKEGVLVIQVPNIDSYQFRAFGKKWVQLSVPQHLCHFTPETIRLALETVGFNVFKILHYSIRNSPLFVSFSLTGINVYKLYQKEKRGESVLFQKLLLLFLNSIFLPFTLLEGWLKKGGVITVFARKSD